MNKKYYSTIKIICFKCYIHIRCFGVCLMVYQPLWDIQSQNHPCRRTVVVLFDLWLGK